LIKAFVFSTSFTHESSGNENAEIGTIRVDICKARSQKKRLRPTPKDNNPDVSQMVYVEESKHSIQNSFSTKPGEVLPSKMSSQTTNWAGGSTKYSLRVSYKSREWLEDATVLARTSSYTSPASLITTLPTSSTVVLPISSSSSSSSSTSTTIIDIEAELTLPLRVFLHQEAGNSSVPIVIDSSVTSIQELKQKILSTCNIPFGTSPKVKFMIHPIQWFDLEENSLFDFQAIVRAAKSFHVYSRMDIKAEPKVEFK